MSSLCMYCTYILDILVLVRYTVAVVVIPFSGFSFGLIDINDMMFLGVCCSVR